MGERTLLRERKNRGSSSERATMCMHQHCCISRPPRGECHKCRGQHQNPTTQDTHPQHFSSNCHSSRRSTYLIVFFNSTSDNTTLDTYLHEVGFSLLIVVCLHHKTKPLHKAVSLLTSSAPDDSRCLSRLDNVTHMLSSDHEEWYKYLEG